MEWTDEEASPLIEQWSKYLVLYNIKHPRYFDKEEKNKAFAKIKEELQQQSINFTVKEINDKITNLRSYYGSQRRLEESSKKSGAGADEVFASKWKFYPALAFSSDNLIPRNTVNNLTSNENLNPSICYDIPNQPTLKKKVKQSQSNSGEIMQLILCSERWIE